MTIGLRLRHPYVLRVAGAHLARRMVLQLPDQILQIPNAQLTRARRIIVLVVVRLLLLLLLLQKLLLLLLLLMQTVPPMHRVHHRRTAIGATAQAPNAVLHTVRIANVLLAAVLRARSLLRKVCVIDDGLLQFGAQMLLADAIVVDRRIAGTGAAMRLRCGRRGFQRFENVLVIAVQSAQRSFDVHVAGVNVAAAAGTATGAGAAVHVLHQLDVVSMRVGPAVFRAARIAYQRGAVPGILFEDAFFCAERSGQEICDAGW